MWSATSSGCLRRCATTPRSWKPTFRTCKADKDLGQVPAGDKYFLGRANFEGCQPGAAERDGRARARRFLARSETSSALRCSFCRDGFLQMIFIDTNGFDKQHYKFDYVRREFLGEVRCLVFRRDAPRRTARGASWDASGWRIRTSTLCASMARTTAARALSWYFHFDSWRANYSRACGCRRSSTAKRRICTTPSARSWISKRRRACGDTTWATPARNRN